LPIHTFAFLLLLPKMQHADWHVYQVLTKRSARLRDLLCTKLQSVASAPHIWWGVSVENRRVGLPRIRDLRQTNARARFLSIEPLLEDLGAIDLVAVHVQPSLCAQTVCRNHPRLPISAEIIGVAVG
jgi:protein gp37